MKKDTSKGLLKNGQRTYNEIKVADTVRGAIQ